MRGEGRRVLPLDILKRDALRGYLADWWSHYNPDVYGIACYTIMFFLLIQFNAYLRDTDSIDPFVLY